LRPKFRTVATQPSGPRIGRGCGPCASRDSQLLKLDSGLAALNNLQSSFTLWAHERSCAMNVWLHIQVMVKLAENGGKVPSELKP
jgi:hypothetical protein